MLFKKLTCLIFLFNLIVNASAALKEVKKYEKVMTLLDDKLLYLYSEIDPHELIVNLANTTEEFDEFVSTFSELILQYNNNSEDDVDVRKANKIIKIKITQIITQFCSGGFFYFDGDQTTMNTQYYTDVLVPFMEQCNNFRKVVASDNYDNYDTNIKDDNNNILAETCSNETNKHPFEILKILLDNLKNGCPCPTKERFQIYGTSYEKLSEIENQTLSKHYSKIPFPEYHNLKFEFIESLTYLDDVEKATAYLNNISNELTEKRKMRKLNVAEIYEAIKKQYDLIEKPNISCFLTRRMHERHHKHGRIISQFNENAKHVLALIFFSKTCNTFNFANNETMILKLDAEVEKAIKEIYILLTTYVNQVYATSWPSVTKFRVKEELNQDNELEGHEINDNNEGKKTFIFSNLLANSFFTTNLKKSKIKTPIDAKANAIKDIADDIGKDDYLHHVILFERKTWNLGKIFIKCLPSDCINVSNKEKETFVYQYRKSENAVQKFVKGIMWLDSISETFKHLIVFEAKKYHNVSGIVKMIEQKVGNLTVHYSNYICYQKAGQLEYGDIGIGIASDDLSEPKCKFNPRYNTSDSNKSHNSIYCAFDKTRGKFVYENNFDDDRESIDSYTHLSLPYLSLSGQLETFGCIFLL